MRFLALNASPRAAGGNTQRLLGHLLAGFAEAHAETPDILCLAAPRDHACALEAVAAAETLLLAYPLYNDAMTSLAKRFIEDLAPLKGRMAGHNLCFLTHSGFPEADHIKPVARYHDRLCRRLGAGNLGTIAVGGSEGLDMKPKTLTGPMFAALRTLGGNLAQSQSLDEAALRRLAGPQRLGWLPRKLNTLIANHLFWNVLLKKNGAFGRRFDRPLLSQNIRTILPRP